MKRQKGVSLIESLLAVVMVGVIVLLLSNLPNAMNLMSKSSHLGIAREIASKQIEDKRAISYINLVNDSVAIVDSRLSQLPSGVGTILVEDCPLEICTNGEQIKQITITINWKENDKPQTTIIKTFIGESGLNQ